MSWRRLSVLVLASSVLLLLLGCAGSRLAMRQGLLRPPSINIRFSDDPLLVLTSYTTPCALARLGSRERQQYYVLVLFMPDHTTPWGTRGRYIFDTHVPC